MIPINGTRWRINCSINCAWNVRFDPPAMVLCRVKTEAEQPWSRALGCIWWGRVRIQCSNQKDNVRLQCVYSHSLVMDPLPLRGGSTCFLQKTYPYSKLSSLCWSLGNHWRYLWNFIVIQLFKWSNLSPYIINCHLTASHFISLFLPASSAGSTQSTTERKKDLVCHEWFKSCH